MNIEIRSDYDLLGRSMNIETSQVIVLGKILGSHFCISRGGLSLSDMKLPILSVQVRG